MKTSTWHHQWVLGLYTTPEEAERLVGLAKQEGVPTDKMVVIGPEPMKRRRFHGLRAEPHHPEYRWMRRGALFGAMGGMAIGVVLFADLLATGFAGLGGAIMGTLIGMLASGADTSLTALYEESGAEGKIMVAINCQPHHQEEIQLASRLIRQSGVEPREFPHHTVH